MCEKLENLMKKQKENVIFDIALNMIHNGRTNEDIQEDTRLPLDKIQQLRAEAAARHE